MRTEVDKCGLANLCNAIWPHVGGQHSALCRAAAFAARPAAGSCWQLLAMALSVVTHRQPAPPLSPIPVCIQLHMYVGHVQHIMPQILGPAGPAASRCLASSRLVALGRQRQAIPGQATTHGSTLPAPFFLLPSQLLRSFLLLSAEYLPYPFAAVCLHAALTQPPHVTHDTAQDARASHCCVRCRRCYSKQLSCQHGRKAASMASTWLYGKHF